MLDSLTHRLVALHRAHRAALEPALSDLGINYGSELALATIAVSPGITPSALAARLDVKPPTVTKVVRHLERGGLVERAADTADGRVIRLEITAEGRRRYRRVRGAWAAAEGALLAGLAADERTELDRLLRAALD